MTRTSGRHIATLLELMPGLGLGGHLQNRRFVAVGHWAVP